MAAAAASSPSIVRHATDLCGGDLIFCVVFACKLHILLTFTLGTFAENVIHALFWTVEALQVALHAVTLRQVSNIYYRDHACTALRSLLTAQYRPCHAQRRHDNPAPQAACTRVARALVSATPTHSDSKKRNVQLEPEMRIESLVNSCREVQRRWSLRTR